MALDIHFFFFKMFDFQGGVVRCDIFKKKFLKKVNRRNLKTCLLKLHKILNQKLLTII